MPELPSSLLKALNLLTIAGGLIFFTQILLTGYNAIGNRTSALGTRTTLLSDRLFFGACLVFLTISTIAAIASMVKVGVPMVASPALLPFVAFGMTVVAATILQGWWHYLLRSLPHNNNGNGNGNRGTGRPAPVKPKTPVLAGQDAQSHPSEA